MSTSGTRSCTTRRSKFELLSVLNDRNVFYEKKRHITLLFFWSLKERLHFLTLYFLANYCIPGINKVKIVQMLVFFENSLCPCINIIFQKTVLYVQSKVLSLKELNFNLDKTSWFEISRDWGLSNLIWTNLFMQLSNFSCLNLIILDKFSIFFIKSKF